VLEALSANPDLKLVLVNPIALDILPLLYREANPSFHDRISTVPEPATFGKVEKALGAGWLLARSQEWLDGAPLPQLFSSPRGKGGGSTSLIPSCSSWELRFPIHGGVAGLTRRDNTLYVVLNEQQAVGELDMGTGKLRIIAHGFQKLRGLALDPLTNTLYVVSNKYQGVVSRAPWNRVGIGQLWAVDVATGAKHAMTRIHWPQTLRGLPTIRGKGKEAYWKQLAGGLRWPTSVLVEEPGRSLLLTEAKAIRRLALKTGKLSTPLKLDLPFNVVGLAQEDRDTVLIGDAGVHPNGFGRLMRGHLDTEAVEVLASGWKGVGGAGFLPARRLALLSLIGPWPRGQVLAVNVDTPNQVPPHRWSGLNGPSQFSYSQTEDQLLVSTLDGIVELRLDYTERHK
jgi:hypothetical protein